MQLYVVDDYGAMSRFAAHLTAERLRAQPEANVVVPTGNTPYGFFRELIALRQQGAFDASRLRVFQLDEYFGIPPDDPRSFSGWITRSFLDPLGITAAQVVRLRGDADDPLVACRDYDAAVRAAGGFDVVVLGLGRNGHLGFNEPPADPAAPTRLVRLSAETIASNEHYWSVGAQVPKHALTCGMNNILTARMKLLLVSGEQKRDILRRTITGPIIPEVPASYLQVSAQVTVVADSAAWPWPQSATVEYGHV